MRKKRTSSGIYIVAALLVVAVAVFLLVRFFFRVEDIHVSGSFIYTEGEISDAADIKKGTFLYSVDKDEIESRIKEALPSVKDVKITRKIPTSIYIEVEDADSRFYSYTETGTVFYTKDLRVTKTAVGKVIDDGKIYVELPRIKRALPGARLDLFEGKDVEGVLYYLDNISSWERFSSVYEIYLSSLDKAGFLYKDNITVYFGGEEKIKTKLIALAALADREVDFSGKKVTVDLSDPQEVAIKVVEE